MIARVILAAFALTWCIPSICSGTSLPQFPRVLHWAPQASRFVDNQCTAQVLESETANGLGVIALFSHGYSRGIRLETYDSSHTAVIFTAHPQPGYLFACWLRECPENHL
jgi:hypothetical protein